MNRILEGIANDILEIETLETRRSDELDFHDIAVWTLREALEAAYKAGAESTRREDAKPTRRPRATPYERTRAAVYATGNKYAIENFHATHD
jgi:hypothetical protein